ncbi:MAG: HNH endonuclease [Acidimicrobiia bacterium]|nr:HNH endonuclease [Acidimicrobiia bacterium]MDH3462342.1 HNH endonuclease [Acidimicrobiia bacterium]
MEWGRGFSDSVDVHESRFLEVTQMISRLHAIQLDELEWLDQAQVFIGDGSRNLGEWVAAKADVGIDTGRRLARTMRRTQNKPWLRESLARGEISFDRVEALSRIDDSKELLKHLDIAGVRRAAADLIEISHEDEARTAADQFLVMQPSLDESWWKLWGGLDGVCGAAVNQALTENADRLPGLPDASQPSLGWRKAMALYELATGGRSPRSHITVFVNAETAVPNGGPAGVRLEAGPRVGAQALTALLCDAVTEVTVNSADGTPMIYGRTTRSIPPRLRRANLASNQGHCLADGCDSGYRIEAHHITPWSEGGPTDPENLVPLCWYHHHVVVHQRGFRIYRHPEHGRIRFRRPNTSTGPPGGQPEG